MADIPQAVLGQPLKGLSLLGRGKVRDTYGLPNNPAKLLMVTSDRVSIFDFVLNALIPLKGPILNALNIFWRTQVFGSVCEHDLIAHGRAIDDFLPEPLRDDHDLQSRTTVVKRCSLIPVECVARGHLTGSGWRDYEETGEVCGHKLPAGLHNGSELPCVIFTPATKAKEGHDLNIGYEGIAKQYGYWPERLALQIFMMARQYAQARGIILPDTKFEFGEDHTVADEMLTPDSSRYWDCQAWKKAAAEKKSPPPLDKEYVRQWGLRIGINKRQPDNPEDVAWVHSQEVPAEVITMTTLIYRYIFWRLTGLRLELFQRTKMGVLVDLPKRNIDVVLGSRSDLDQAEKSIKAMTFSGSVGKIRTHIISCHRNPEALRDYAQELKGVDVVIAGAGKAAALPGVLASWLNHFGKPYIPVIGVGFEGQYEEADDAAALSIEELPGKPVILDQDGTAFFGPGGFHDACAAALGWEFLPRTPPDKPAEFNIELS